MTTNYTIQYLLGSASVVREFYDITAAPYSCDPTGNIDCTTQIQAFFDYITTHNVRNAKVEGIFKVSNQLFLGPSLSADTMLTKYLYGNMILEPNASINDILTVRNADSVRWVGGPTIIGTGGETYSSRGCNRALVIKESDYMIIDSVTAKYMRGDAITVDGTLNAYNNLIGQITANFIGSCANTPVIANWGTRVDTGSSGAYDQRSTITPTIMPHTDFDAVPKTVIINEGSLSSHHQIISINRGAGTISLFPYIANSVTSGTLSYIYGSGYRILGANAAGGLVDEILATQCGNGASIESLYGPHISLIQAQACGAALAIGESPQAAMYGLNIDMLYSEEFLGYAACIHKRSNSIKGCMITVAAPAHLSQCKDSGTPWVVSYNKPHTTYSGFQGIRIGGRKYVQPPASTEQQGQAAIIDCSEEKHPTFMGLSTGTFYINLTITEPEQNALYGISRVSFTVVGTGTNGVFSGKVNITPPTGWTLNGGATNAAADFLGFSGPVVFEGYLDFTTSAITLGKLENDATISVSANTTLTGAYKTVRVDASGGAKTITLPAAANCTGKIYHIKKIDSSGNTVTIDANASETIDGALTLVISTQYQTKQIQSNGTNWDVIN